MARVRSHPRDRARLCPVRSPRSSFPLARSCAWRTASGLQYISELATRHVEVPDQVAARWDLSVFVQGHRHRSRTPPQRAVHQGERRRGPLVRRLRPLNRHGHLDGEDGNYKYPEGFDPETNEWMEGYEAQREQWEAQYAIAQERWLAHKAQVAEALEADSDTLPQDAATFASSSEPSGGTLASDEALAALH